VNDRPPVAEWYTVNSPPAYVETYTPPPAPTVTVGNVTNPRPARPVPLSRYRGSRITLRPANVPVVRSWVVQVCPPSAETASITSLPEVEVGSPGNWPAG
jgi:hypothetical protein